MQNGPGFPGPFSRVVAQSQACRRRRVTTVSAAPSSIVATPISTSRPTGAPVNGSADRLMLVPSTVAGRAADADCTTAVGRVRCRPETHAPSTISPPGQPFVTGGFAVGTPPQSFTLVAQLGGGVQSPDDADIEPPEQLGGGVQSPDDADIEPPEQLGGGVDEPVVQPVCAGLLRPMPWLRSRS